MTLDLDHPIAPAARTGAGALAPDPAHRLRRTRRTETLRAFVRETRTTRASWSPRLRPARPRGTRAVGSMPGVMRVTPDEALRMPGRSRRWASAA